MRDCICYYKEISHSKYPIFSCCQGIWGLASLGPWLKCFTYSYWQLITQQSSSSPSPWKGYSPLGNRQWWKRCIGVSPCVILPPRYCNFFPLALTTNSTVFLGDCFFFMESSQSLLLFLVYYASRPFLMRLSITFFNWRQSFLLWLWLFFVEVIILGFNYLIGLSNRIQVLDLGLLQFCVHTFSQNFLPWTARRSISIKYGAELKLLLFFRLSNGFLWWLLRYDVYRSTVGTYS